MGFLKRRDDHRIPSVMTADSSDLARIGWTAYGGDSPHPTGTIAVPAGELDGYVIAALEATGYPEVGSQPWTVLEERFLEELMVAAEAADSWAVVGAFCVAANFVAPSEAPNPRYLEIIDRTLVILRDDGVAYPAVPPFALRRWDQVHGTDGLFPAGWPSALENLAVPGPGEEPPVQDLADGESRRLAQRELGGGPNTIYAERSPDGRIVAVIDGIDSADNQRKRWDWLGLSVDNYPAFLRELGDRLVTPTQWAHDDLQPYFPCRARSREQMRRSPAPE